jgi:hypothetical protein
MLSQRRFRGRDLRRGNDDRQAGVFFRRGGVEGRMQSDRPIRLP